MARYRQFGGERYIEADNGFDWTRGRHSSVLSVAFSVYTFPFQGVVYELEKFRDPAGGHGWYLCSRGDTYFVAEYCDTTLLAAVDVASAKIVKADLRGPGYEKETEG